MSVILKLMTLIDQGTTSYFSSHKSSFTSSSFFRLWLPSLRDALSSIRWQYMCCRSELQHCNKSDFFSNFSISNGKFFSQRVQCTSLCIFKVGRHGTCKQPCWLLLSIVKNLPCEQCLTTVLSVIEYVSFFRISLFLFFFF